MIVFGCVRSLPRPYDDPDYQGECAVVPALQCSFFFTGWAIGQGPIYWYDPAPIGAGEGAVKDFLLQAHIDNPNSDSGLKEPGWGLFFWYTPTTTATESGAFGLYSGVPLGGMPPGVAEFSVQSECASRMTKSAFREGVYISSVTPHGHALLKSTSLELLRERPDGTWYEHAKVWQQDHWDANWQGYRALTYPGVWMEPGDRLIVKCTFDTSNVTDYVRNGEGFEDEMCIAYISYFPRESITICAEFPPTVLPPYERMSGVGLSFADVPPFFFPVNRRDEHEPLPPPLNVCSSNRTR